MNLPSREKAGRLPVDLLRFIASHIQSVEQLEILCLLVEAPNRVWSVDDVFAEIQSTRRSVSACLEHLFERGLVSREPDGGFRFSPGSAELARWAIDLARTYRDRRVTVIGSIYQKAAPV